MATLSNCSNPPHRADSDYTITKEGRRALKDETAQWERLSAVISGIVRPA